MTPTPSSQKKGKKKKKSTKRTEKWKTASDDSDQEICTFAMVGTCKSAEEGHKCGQSHEVAVRKFMKPCKFYMANSCNLTDSTCPYLHQDFPCKFYHLNGRCMYGESCRFSHEKTESTIHMLEKFIEEENSRLAEGMNSSSQVKGGTNTATTSTLIQKPSCTSTVIELPVLRGFYNDKDDVPEESSETPLPAVFDALLPPETVSSSESSVEDNQEEDYQYPAKIILVDLPPLKDDYTSDQNDNPTPQINLQMQWRLREALGIKTINYTDLRVASSVREILMDPRLKKYKS